MNLTAIEDPLEVARRHFSEGIIAGDWLLRNTVGGAYIDLGSGNGFPAVPIAIICNTAAPLVMIESSEKRSAFLRALIRELGWDWARVEQRRARKSSDLSDLSCRIFSSRGVAISTFLEEGLPFLQSGGHCVLFGTKGTLGIDTERVPSNLRFITELPIPARDSAVLIFSKVLD